MKKALAITLAVIIVALLFASCGSGSQNASSPVPYYTQSKSPETTLPKAPENSVFGLSSDYRSGQIQIDGVIYTLPMKGSEFMSHGWSLADSFNVGEIVEPDDNSSARLYNGSSYITAYFKNYNTQPFTIENCFIYEIYVTNKEDLLGSAILPGGLDFSNAKYQDFISKWGTPSYDGIAAGYGDSIIHYEIGNYEEDYKYFISLRDDYSIETVGLTNKNRPANIDVDVSTVVAETTTSQMQTVPATTAAKQDSNPLSSVQINVTNHVNVPALDALMKTDQFELKVEAKGYDKSNARYSRVIIAGAPSGNDNYFIVMSNKTSSEVKNVNALIVAYDSNYAPVQFGLTSMGDTKIRQLSSDVSIPANDIGAIAITNIDSSQIAGFAVLAYSYTDASGQVHTNPLAETWLRTVYS